MIAVFKKQKEDAVIEKQREVFKKDFTEIMDDRLKNIPMATNAVPSSTTAPVPDPMSSGVLSNILIAIDSINKKIDAQGSAIAAQESTIASLFALRSPASPLTVPAVPSSSFLPVASSSPSPATVPSPVLVVPSTGITEEFVNEITRQVKAIPSPLSDNIRLLWYSHKDQLDLLLAGKTQNALRNILKDLGLPHASRVTKEQARSILTVFRMAHSIPVDAELK